MPYRIEAATRDDVNDVSGENLKTRINQYFNLNVSSIRVISVYIVDLPLSPEEAAKALKEIFYDPVIQNASFDTLDTGAFDWGVEIRYKHGVTDAVGETAKGAVEDLLERKFHISDKVYTGKQYRISAAGITAKQVVSLGSGFLGNPVIETIDLQSYGQWKSSSPFQAPIRLQKSALFSVCEIELPDDDNELVTLSKDRTLSLNLEEMRAIRSHFDREDVKKSRKDIGISETITDVELEAIAQTWSEHCKHKIFNSRIQYTDNGSTEIIDGLFPTYIKGSTSVIAEKIPWLLSVFTDNAGVIKFNEEISLVYKVETHNSPSALEPYGGALTGIVGVNRDPMGTGIGAQLLFNVWGYCLGSPFYNKSIPSGLLHPGRIREGVHQGVIDGGNQSGIPYGRGWEYFDDRYIGKPMVFCGTVGWMPSKICGLPSHEKKADPGDNIVMVGGRIGKDGIHGATFSSEELHQDSPVQAVQIGDPITQKKMSDFLIEARDKGLYSCITDNGAGGLSSSVGEMAQMSGGCILDLAKAPLKYEGLEPWEILLSEAQERMTLAVHPEKLAGLLELAEKRGVESKVVGEYTDSGKFHVYYGDKTVAYLDMEFLHDGLPQMNLKAVWKTPQLEEPDFDEPRNIATVFKTLLGRLNISSIEGKTRQYDHEVKGLSVIKPFVGKDMDVPSDATVFLVEYGKNEGIILAEGKNPGYSDIDTYHMTASVIDEAVRRVISSGGKLGTIAGLDNFCWPDPIQSDKTPDGHYKLAQLVRANKALYDYTVAFSVPCISGKDSMKNDSIFGDVKISIPPTLLFSVLGKIDDVSKAVTMDVKAPGDIVYIVGETFFELGGSEYYKLIGEELSGTSFIGKSVPKVSADNALKIYKAVGNITSERLARSIHTPVIGGLGIALAQSAFAGGFGLEIDLSRVPYSGPNRNDFILFSESNSRFIITVHPGVKEQFEQHLEGTRYAEIGSTIDEPVLKINGINGEIILEASLAEMKNIWKDTFKDFYNASS
jgi:phosphoribosylformylglycinamidine synthase II